MGGDDKGFGGKLPTKKSFGVPAILCWHSDGRRFMN
jgi:hypothetical protein